MKRYCALLFGLLLAIPVMASVLPVPRVAAWTMAFTGSGTPVSGSSCTGNYGNTNTGTYNESGAQWLMILRPITIDCSSSSYTVNVYGHHAYGENYKVVLYTKTGTGSGSLVEESTAIATAGNEDDAWLGGSYTFTTSVSAGDYYAGIIVDNDYIGIYAQAETGGEASRTTLGSFTAPSSLSSMTAEEWNMCIYIGF
jgi:hypothetical protein